MKTGLRYSLYALALMALLLVAAIALVDNPMRRVETMVLSNADVLPVGYFGERLFDEHCASCHDNPAMHAPTREALSGFALETLMVALEFGKMQPMAAHLPKWQRGLISLYLTGSAEPIEWIAEHRCDDPVADDITPYVSNWGLGGDNRRFISTQKAGIDRNNVGTLELAWSLALPRVADMRSQPAIIGDTLYFGDKTGKLYAIDRQRGCVLRHTEVLSGIRSAITVVERSDGSKLLVFADSMASIYAVDAATFDVRWQSEARLFDTSVISGSISHHDNKLFVPVSSYEVAVAGSPDYPCCHSHGGVIALDARDGKPLWQWHGTPEASPRGRNRDGIEQFGPSGVSVWSTPAVDPTRNRIYIGTSQNLSQPATDTSDAIIALDMDSGEVAWQFQALAGDAWNAACLNDGANCPEDAGGDFDFGASVIIADLPRGGQLLLAGQKSGEVFALNPDPAGFQGEVIWRRRVSQGTTNGGIHWGMSLAGTRLLVPVADPEREHRPDYTPQPGLSALDLATGAVLWQHPVARGCKFNADNRPKIGLESLRSDKPVDPMAQYRCSYYYGLSAAATTTPDLVFSNGLDGTVRIFDIASGDILWQAQTAAPFLADNGIEGHGGAIDVSGQTLADGWLYVQSGYSMFGQLPGNMLLAYRVSP